VDLIILESPNKVRDVEQYARTCGFEAKAIATVGHLFDLPPMAEGSAIDTATFALTSLQPRDSTASDRIGRIRAAIAQADRVIVATDPDREGEAIGAELWAWIPRAKAWRAIFEEITKAGVERGLREMRQALALSVVEAAHTRRVIDRLAGWHGTALVFDKLRQHKGLSAGRLQSAALRLVVERHRDYDAFRATTSYGLRVVLRTDAGTELRAVLVDEQGVERDFPTDDDARRVTLPPSVSLTEAATRRKEQRPRPPFEASSWLQVASKVLGLSVKEATQAAQALFETGHTTYPRTDTVRVAEEAIAWARKEIATRFGPAYVQPNSWQHTENASSPVQAAHEAIRPTIPHDDDGSTAIRRTGPWADAYALIEARFLASQASCRVLEQTTLRFTGGGLHLLARGQVEVFDGWRRVLAIDAQEEPDQLPSDRADGDEQDADGQLPGLAAGDQLSVVRAEVIVRATKPRPLFTQASLVAELKRLGIGRPSTYQAVVPLILSRGWATEQVTKALRRGGMGKTAAPPSLVPTAAGRDLCAFLVEALPSLVDYEFTASMEKAIDEIEEGTKGRGDVASAWWRRFERELGAAKSLKARYLERKDLGPCPKCAREGRAGRLRLIQGVSAATNRPYEFAACDVDTKDVRVCGYKGQTDDGELLVSPPCPECQQSLRAVTRKDGGRSWVCEKHGWLLAGRRWELVVAPQCPRCSSPMVHRERRDPKGEFFWACFNDRVFLGSDRFGRVESTRRSRGTA
jgi:DNA topoisomerase-1